MQPAVVLNEAKLPEFVHEKAVCSAGVERAVIATVAPPFRNRSEMALPAPLVPPVTRTRLPLNSAALNAVMERY